MNRKLQDLFFEKAPGTAKKAPALAQAIVDKSGNKLRFGGSKRGAFRIQRANSDLEVSAEELLFILKACKYNVLKMVPPGSPGAASGKFNTWFLETDEGKNFTVVFGQGQNAGHKYEDQVINDLQSSQNKDPENRSELYKALMNAFGLQSDDVKEFRKTSSKHVKRPITKEISDVGPVISDIDVILKDGRHIYISLKNENGLTFANSGYHGGFIVKPISNVEFKTPGPVQQIGEPPAGHSQTYQRTINSLMLVPGSHPLDDFVFALGIDKQRAADGINDYLQQKQTTREHQKVPTQFEPEKIQNYLASAYGYGYWYVKAGRNGTYQIVNLDTPEAALQKVGEVNSVVVTYPHYNSYTVQQKKRGEIKNLTKVKASKQISAWVDTSTATYVVEIRNSRVGFNPNEIKIKIIATKG